MNFTSRFCEVKHYVLFVFILISFHQIAYSQLYINEVMASNTNTIADESGVFEDWIEIYNAGNTPVDLAGYYFSDEPANPLLYQVPAGSPGLTTVPAHGFLLLWADKNLTEGAHHINIKLSSSGEILTMVAPDGTTLVNTVTFGAQSENVSYGRYPDGTAFFQLFTSPTPGATNYVTPLPATYSGQIAVRLTGPNDDAEQNSSGSGSMYLSNYKIALVQGFTNFKTGFLFRNIQIPQGATITKATVQFTTADGGTNTSNLTIKAHDADHATDFVTTALNISNRPLTTAAVSWSPPAWSARYSHGPNQQTPDIKTVIQEIVDRTGWNSGNNMAIIITGSGTRNMYSYEAFPEDAAYLEIEYTAAIPAIPATGLKINEISPNSTTYLDDTDNEEDWVELYNAGSQPVQLAGLFVSDNSSNLLKWQIGSAYTVNPGMFATIWPDEEVIKGGFHANFGLSKNGEKVFLSQVINNQVVLLDSITFPAVGLLASYGRIPDGTGAWALLGTQTPKSSNNNAKLWTAPPVITPDEGIMSAGITVSITHSNPVATLRYTLDGSTPTTGSLLYTGSFNVSTNKTVRARAFLPGNYEPSVEVQKSYLFNPSTNLPILHLTTDPDNLFDPETGIYVVGVNGTEFGYCANEYPANFINDWERPAHLTMYEPDGTKAFSVNGGVKISGGCSRYNDLKSLNFYLRSSKYGDSEIDYPLFSNRTGTKYKRLKLRNSGQDFQHTLFRDAFNHMILSDSVFNMETQSYRPAIVYLNDEYWGILNMREIYSDNYFKRLFDLEEEEIDLIQNPILLNEVEEGDDSDYRELWQWFNTNSLTNAANFEYAASRLDLDNAMNYWMSMTYMSSHDWPANNLLIWRPTINNGKWRYCAQDTDATTSIYGATGTTGYTYDALTYALNPNAVGWPNDAKATLFFRKLMENQWFREEFIQRTCTYMEIQWDPTRISNLIDSLKNVIAPEVPAHLSRWSQSLPYLPNVTTWLSRVTTMKTFWQERPAYWRDIVKNKYNLTGSFDLHFNYTAQTPGTVTINSNKIKIPFDYTGTYFKNVPIEVSVVAHPGHVFSYWLETGDTSPTIFFSTGATTATLTPIFDDNTSVLPQTINFPYISNKLTNNPPFSVTATASSGLPVTLQIISGPATINGNTITLNGTIGTVTVKASQPGNSQFQPAPDVFRSFEVTAPGLLNQTISFPAISGKTTNSPPFTVTASASSGLPVTFAMVSGPATINGNTITLTGLTGTVTVSANQAGNAQYNPAPQVLNSFSVSQPTGVTYCNSASTAPWVDWISLVQLNTINNPTAKSTYSNFTNISTSLTKSVSYPLTLKSAYSYTSYTEYFRVWIDYNINGIFEDAEIAYQGILNAPPNGTLSGTLNGNIIVPATASTGTTRMRVSMKRNAYATACEIFPNGEVEDYTVNLVPGGGGTSPQTITFPAIANKLTTSPPFTISATASSGLPVSFSIVSGPATINGNTITLTGNAGTVTVRAFQPGNAQYDPAPDVLVSFVVSTPSGNTYCTSVSNYPWHEWISRLQLNTINNQSGKTNYSNFTNISTNLLQGSNYPVTVTVGYSYFTYNEYCRIWIDYNNNYQFEDNEIAFQSILNAPPNGTTSALINGNITVPANANPGLTRMRISLKRGAYPTACETLPNGEVEDYTVNITTTQNLVDLNPGFIDDDLVLLANRDIDRVVLHWADATLEPVSYHLIEKSSDGLIYEPLVYLHNQVDFYGIEYDENPLEGVNFYRLKAVMPDLSYRYSPTAQIDFEKLPDLIIYPNPASDEVFVQLGYFKGQPLTILVYDALGHEIFQESIANLDQAAWRLDASNWINGIYTIVVGSEFTRRFARKVVIAR